jgi:phosphatidylinositol glycan class A protein
VDPTKISVISNAVDTACFTPDPSQRNPDYITIVVISRLVYRKGVDLLAGLIPIICSSHPNVQFIVGGDGPKRIVLEEVIEHHQLQKRVTLLGSVKHDDVRNVLVKGDIFLNSSLTEAFCMAIVEASSCGLQVVSTNVGGIPEVLPSDLVWLAEPSVAGLLHALNTAISDKEAGNVVDPFECHRRIGEYYQWNDIASRTLTVYELATNGPESCLSYRLQKLLSCGPIFGPVFVLIALIEHLLSFIYSLFVPNESIDLAEEMSFDHQRSKTC